MVKKTNIIYTGQTDAGKRTNDEKFLETDEPSFKCCYKCKSSGYTNEDEKKPASALQLLLIRDMYDKPRLTMVEYNLCNDCIGKIMAIDEIPNKAGELTAKQCVICHRAHYSQSWIHEFDEVSQLDNSHFKELDVQLFPLRTGREYPICNECHELLKIMRRLDFTDKSPLVYLPADTRSKYSELFGVSPENVNDYGPAGA